jgi:hypothetical protein
MESESQLGLRFSVQYQDGRRETLTVDAERALIGSGAHCEVRLSPYLVSPEHVEVFTSGGQVYLDVRAREDIPAMLNDVPVAAGPWPKGAVLALGTTRFVVDIVELNQRRRGRSPMWLLVPIPFAAAAAGILYAGSAGSPQSATPPAPPLFDGAAQNCTVTSADARPAFAAEKLRLALAKRERGPFSPRDSVEAVPLFETASACFQAAGQIAVAVDAATAATNLRTKLDGEYRVRRVRLEHAVQVADPAAAKRELRVLLPLTAHRPGPYQDWLMWLDRFATRELERRDTRRLGS